MTTAFIILMNMFWLGIFCLSYKNIYNIKEIKRESKVEAFVISASLILFIWSSIILYVRLFV